MGWVERDRRETRVGSREKKMGIRNRELCYHKHPTITEKGRVGWGGVGNGGVSVSYESWDTESKNVMSYGSSVYFLVRNLL